MASKDNYVSQVEEKNFKTTLCLMLGQLVHLIPSSIFSKQRKMDSY